MEKILMIENVDLSLNDAPKVHFLNLAKEFTKLGFNVCGILPKPRKKLDFETERLPFKIIFTPAPFKSIRVLGTFLKYLFQPPAITKEVFRKPNFIYIRLSPYSIIPCLWINLVKIFIKKSNVKVVGELNGWIPDEWKINGVSSWRIAVVEKLLRWNVQLIDGLRVVTVGLKDIILPKTKINPRKIFVVGNGTDTELFRPVDKIKAREKIGIDHNLSVIGFVGNLAKWQGVEYLIEAAPIILKDIPNVQFVIVGGGPELKNLKQQVKRLKISEKIIFIGRVSYREVPHYINSFDIATATFTVERNKKCGLSPLKIYDYAACGIPIVASRLPGLEIIEKYNIGVLATPEKPREVANAVIKLLRDTQKRKIMGERARKIAEQNFSWNKVTKEIAQNIKNI